MLVNRLTVMCNSYSHTILDMFGYRIRTERNGGAWCPFSPITRGVEEWIEIDLQELKVITQVETQGRFGNGQVRIFSKFSHRNTSDLDVHCFHFLSFVFVQQSFWINHVTVYGRNSSKYYNYVNMRGWTMRNNIEGAHIMKCGLTLLTLCIFVFACKPLGLRKLSYDNYIFILIGQVKWVSESHQLHWNVQLFLFTFCSYIVWLVKIVNPCMDY